MNLPSLDEAIGLVECPGSGELGIESLEGYCLQKESPCINSATFIPNHGERDFYDNPVPSDQSTDRGAHEFVKAAKVQNRSGTDSKLAVFQNSPNPFNASTNIQYELDQSGNIKITIW